MRRPTGDAEGRSWWVWPRRKASRFASISISFVVEGFASPSLSLAVHGLDRMIADLPGSEACKTDAFLPCAVVQLSASSSSPFPFHPKNSSCSRKFQTSEHELI
jgi:hypothetical protein